MNKALTLALSRKRERGLALLIALFVLVHCTASVWGAPVVREIFVPFEDLDVWKNDRVFK